MESFYQFNNLLHTIIGSLALLGALIALVTIKGSDKHKAAGRIFAWCIIITSATSFYPLAIKFKEIGPLALIMSVATIYLTATSLIAIRHQGSEVLIAERFLPIIPLILVLLPVILLVRAVISLDFSIFLGPISLVCLFAYLLTQDIAILRNRQRPTQFWIQRHLTRMIFAFAFALMGLIRIGIDFGISFELSVVLPLLLALILVIFFNKQIDKKFNV